MNLKGLIAEVREHHRRATPGPWHVQHGAIRVDLPGPIQYTWALSAYPKDCALIAHYRTAAPLLADEVERLNAENATLRSNLQSIEHALSTRRKPGETREWTIAGMLADLDRAEQERTAIRAAVGLPVDASPLAVLEQIRRLQGKCGEPGLTIAAERSQDSGAWVREVKARNRLDIAPIGLQWNDRKPEPDPEKVAAFKAEMGVLCAQFEETHLTLLAEQGKPEGAASDRWRVSHNLHGFKWWRGEDDDRPEVECHLSGGEWRWTKPGFESNPYPTARACMLAADKDSP